MGIHDGHRERMRKRFRDHGLENFDDHNVLELILFYAIPRGDVNPLAHRLLNTFGSLSSVFDANIEELMKVEGVGLNAATLIKMMPQICRRYMMSRVESEVILTDSRATGEFLVSLFYGEKSEVVYLLCLDAKCKLLAAKCVGRGEINSANVSVRKIVECAILYNATSVILAHNHTSGIALPSKEDETATERIRDALDYVGVTLVDHIVVADDDFVSMADNGFFE